MALFILFADSSTAVDIEPEYDYKESDQKIEDKHRAKSGAEFRYKWGEYRKFEFSLMYVNSSDMSQINSWWGGNEALTFVESGTGVEHSVRITNKKKPIDRRIKPYADQFRGKLVLETYL